MKFKDKYPNQPIDPGDCCNPHYNHIKMPEPGSFPPDVDNGMARCGRFFSCEVCKTPTDWYDITWEGLRFCSEECRMEFNKQVEEYLKETHDN